MKKNIYGWLSAAALLLGTTAVQADSTWLTDAAGDISTGTNWVGGTSPFTDGTAVNAGTITINSGAPTYTALTLSGTTKANISGIAAITNGGNVTLTTNGTDYGLSIDGVSWTLAGTSMFTAGASDTHTVLNLTGATTLKAGTYESFTFLGSGLSGATGVINIGDGAKIVSSAAQVARAGGTSVTININNGGTWTNTGGGRLGESGTVVMNVNEGGKYTLSGYAADQYNASGSTTINLNGGTITEAFTLATRGIGIMNILAGVWNMNGNTQVIAFGADSRAKGTVYQTGGTVTGGSVSFGSSNTSAGKYGGNGAYYLNGGTLTLTANMSQYDMKAAAGEGTNVTGTFYMGLTTAGEVTTGGLASIGSLSNISVNAAAGTLYTKGIAQREGTSTLKGTASIHIQDTLPATLEAGTAGVYVTNSALALTGTAVMNIEGVETYVGNTSAAAPAVLTLKDSAKLNVTAPSAQTQHFYLNGTDGASYGALTLEGNSVMTFTNAYFVSGSNSAENPSVITLRDNAQLLMRGSITNNGYFMLGGKNNIDGTNAYSGKTKLILQDNARLETVSAQLAGGNSASSVTFEMTGGTWVNIGSGRFGDAGTFTLNQSGGNANIGYAMLGDGGSSVTTLNVSGGTLTGNNIVLATRGKATINISADGTFNASSLIGAYNVAQAGKNQVAVVNQTGGTLTVEAVKLSTDAAPNTMPVYKISGGTANITNFTDFDLEQNGGTMNVTGTMTLNSADINYKSGTLNINKLIINENAQLGIEMTDDYLSGSNITVNELSGTGTIFLSAGTDFHFNPSAVYTLMNTANNGANLDLSGISFAGDLGSDLTYAFDGNKLLIATSAALPEPASWLLLLAGTLGFCVFRKRRA